MSRFKSILGLAVLLTMASSVQARPVRVLILKILVSSGWVHPSIKNGTPSFETMLKNPAGLTGAASLVNSTLGTGEGITIPQDGFLVDTVGNATLVNGTSPSTIKFMSMLDTIDVLVMANTLGFGGVLTSTTDRNKFLEFAKTKGIVAFHSANDNHSPSSTAGTWAAYDSLCGAMFKDHATANVNMLRDTLPVNTTDSNFAPLNKGLVATYRFNEELYSLTKNPRLSPGFHVLYTLDEKSYTPSTKMGDHPYVYYNESLSGLGGRYWYSSEGHTDSLFQKNYSFRRQFYNAVLWASKYVEDPGRYGVTAITPGKINNVKSGVYKTSVNGNSLVLSPVIAGPFTAEVRGLDGKKIASARSENGTPVEFQLNGNMIYTVIAQMGNSRQAGLVTLP
jgi:type 1 glutamine amidotransferase